MENIILKGSELNEKKPSLKKVEVDKVNWKVYYLDEKTNEKWVEEYPHSEMHGGGPPQLRLLDKFPWE
ncbi:MAG TPA: Imm27 family immunity protein [Chitinophagaceae bacterium]|nr:Imm27 family immunity protein [Chitinophagaceae bacterium]